MFRVIFISIFLEFLAGNNAFAAMYDDSLKVACNDLSVIAYWSATSHLSKADKEKRDKEVSEALKGNRARGPISQKAIDESIRIGSFHGNQGQGLDDIDAAREGGILNAIGVYEMCTSGEFNEKVFDDSKNNANVLDDNKKLEESGYLPFTLIVDGYTNGDTCEITELAKSFDGAKKWMRESSGWNVFHSMNEYPTKIMFTYYDGLLKRMSIRTFYKDMKTCKEELIKNKNL